MRIKLINKIKVWWIVRKAKRNIFYFSKVFLGITFSPLQKRMTEQFRNLPQTSKADRIDALVMKKKHWFLNLWWSIKYWCKNIKRKKDGKKSK